MSNKSLIRFVIQRDSNNDREWLNNKGLYTPNFENAVTFAYASHAIDERDMQAQINPKDYFQIRVALCEVVGGQIHITELC